MGRSRSVAVASAVIAASGLVVLATGASAPARKVDAQLRVTTSCTPRTVLVRLLSGATKDVSHADPGPTTRVIGAGAERVYVVVRLGKSWQSVKSTPGTWIRLTASGPKGERWQWAFPVRSENPEVDSSDWVGCLRPDMKGGRSFLVRMRQNPGAWRFTALVTKGALVGTTTGGTIVVRRPPSG